MTSAFGGEVDDLIRLAPSREAYPEAGALILLDRKVVTVDKNNSPTLERTLVVKIFEDRGRDEFGEVTQQFNKDGQTVEVLSACTHKPDGSIVKPEARAISDVSAPEVADAMAYTNAMLKVISFPALEKDAVIEYRVRVKPGKSAKEDGFSGVVRFGGMYPALKREFRLVVPKGVAFKHAWSRDAVRPVVETLPGAYGFTWTITNTPQIFEEMGMPDVAKLVPVLSYSSYKNWKQVATKLRKDFDKGRIASPVVKRLSDSLAAGKSVPEAVKAIYLFVAQKLRNVWLDYGDAGYETHKSPDVLGWKYGDCRDKNRLFVCLLAAQGIPATPVALARILPASPDIACPDVFDWLGTTVTVNEEPVLFDPFAEYRLYGNIPEDVAGVPALVLDTITSELGESPRVGLAVGDLAVSTAEMALNLNGDLTGTVSVEADGTYDNSLREQWRDQTPSDRKRALAQTASSIKTGATIDSFWFSDLGDLAAPAKAGFRFTAPRYAVTQRGELSMRMPTPSLVGDPVFGITSSARRTTPVETKPARIYVYKCTVRLPAEARVDILPDSVAVGDTSGSSEGGWARTTDGVSFYYAIRLLKSDYKLAEFPKLKAAVDAIARPQFREVYFLK